MLTGAQSYEPLGGFWFDMYDRILLYFR